MLTYDGAQAVQARTWAGAVAWTAAWGPGVDHLVSVEKEGHEYFALDDGKGSVVGWLDGVSNQVVGRAEYTPEGLGRFVDEVAGTTCEETDGARCPRPLDLPFGFHTAYGSKVTGLLYFRNRWYSPEANQWLSQDPLDAVDSFNLYAFNGFDSVNFVDPWGLDNTDSANQGKDLRTGAELENVRVPRPDADGLLNELSMLYDQDYLARDLARGELRTERACTSRTCRVGGTGETPRAGQSGPARRPGRGPGRGPRGSARTTGTRRESGGDLPRSATLGAAWWGDEPEQRSHSNRADPEGGGDSCP